MNTDLAFIRNQLKNGKCNQNVKDSIKITMDVLQESKSPFSGICRQACQNALDDIAEGKYELAGYEINLIHNMPIKSEEVKGWDEEHFYLYELPVYFEHLEDALRVKKMLILLADLARI
jgi:hypothetical protein